SSLILSRLELLDRVFVSSDCFNRVVLGRTGSLWRSSGCDMRSRSGWRNVCHQLRGQNGLLFGLVLISSISQNKLDGALLSCEYEFLRVTRAEQQRDHVDGLRLAFGIRF